MCTFTARDGQYALSKKQNRIEISHKEKKAKKRKVKRSKAKKRKERRREKNGVHGGVPLCAADKNFPNERKNKRTCNKRKNNKEENTGIKRMPR